MLYQLSYVRAGSILPFNSRRADAGFAGFGFPMLKLKDGSENPPIEVIMAREAGRTSIGQSVMTTGVPTFT
jgi:hypothetical protein